MRNVILCDTHNWPLLYLQGKKTNKTKLKKLAYSHASSSFNIYVIVALKAAAVAVAVSVLVTKRLKYGKGIFVHLSKITHENKYPSRQRTKRYSTKK